MLGVFIPARPLQAQDDRLVLAFYYAWFDWDTWAKDLSDQPVTPYLSTDIFAIERHVCQAQQAGIDALVQAWYGPDVENNQTETNFWALLEQSQAHGMSAAVSVDMGDASFLQSSEEILFALLTLRDQHTQHAAYLRVGNRPVVFFWKQEEYSVASWEAIRNQVDPDHTMLWIAEGARPEYLTVFDGLYLYSVAWANDPSAVLVRWGNEVRSWRQTNESYRYWVATVMPGYDDLVTGRTDAYVSERQNGVFYRTTWEGAIRSQADWVVITSFNEWLEGTQIEPAVGYGDTYLDLTAQLAETYRTTSYQTPTPTVEILPTDTPEVPTDTPEVPTATPEPVLPTATATVVIIPTATLTPTATPFRLSTPTLTPSPTFQPTAILPPAPTIAYEERIVVTLTPVRPRLLTVEGVSSRPKTCALSLVIPIGWALGAFFLRKHS